MKKRLLQIFFCSVAFLSYGQKIDLKPIGTYSTGIFDEGAAEIVAYSPSSKRAFFTNANANSISVLDVTDATNPILIKDISQSEYGGGVNSVAIYGDMIAVAVEGYSTMDNGMVTLWSVDGSFINALEVGVLPDNIIFSKDGNYIMTANEGEPSDDYTLDPEGSVSIIDISLGAANATVKTVTFESLGTKEEMLQRGVRIFGPNATVAMDLEPEYLAEIEGENKVVVNCQENNAYIIVDMIEGIATDIFSYGLKDHSIENLGFDGSDKDDTILIRTQPTMGMYLPDAIKTVKIGEVTYLVTANEGDSRDYDGFSEEVRVDDLILDPTAYPNADVLQEKRNLGRLKTTTVNGDIDGDGDIDQIYSYGARSFSIWNVSTGELVYDSRDEFEKVTAAAYPNNFNANNDDNNSDKRSDDKGPEPEAIEIATIGDNVFAFIGLERMGGIMVYDITNPEEAEFVSYTNNRDFSADVETVAVGDLGVEDIQFVSAVDSPNGKAMLITANEVSGTITFFEVSGSIFNNKVSIFDEEINITDFEPIEMVLPPSPLTTQVLFVGGHDIVQTTPTYGNPAGRQIAKEWNDFIGFTPDTTGASLGWVGINHEQIFRDDLVGDGGGMTAFQIAKDDQGGVKVVPQTLEDGRTGDFFNVDFVNTVGETGMNCGGIIGPNGRIWTAEEWYRSNNSSLWNSSARTSNLPYRVAGITEGFGVRDTSAFTIDTPEFPLVDGMTISKHDNFNYMTEVDLKTAQAIRKQYNWGRAGWEGGAISNDGKYVYLGIDATPSVWVRFEAETPFDFTKGTLTFYKEDNSAGQRWVEIPQTVENVFGGLIEYAVGEGATMFVRNEWVTIDRETGIIYWTETGRDSGSSGPGIIFNRIKEAGLDSKPASYHNDIAVRHGAVNAFDPAYQDYYGRVMAYDPATEEIQVVIHGGPYLETSPAIDQYPSKHLSNPDGLSTVVIDGMTFLMIQEDLNGSSYGRTPEGISNRLCELYLLPISSRNAEVDELIRVTAIPKGAEITGAVQVDANTILVNSQHPNPNNPFPYNHSLTVAINGFEGLTIKDLTGDDASTKLSANVIVNEVTREITFETSGDYALYNMDGKRIKVIRNQKVFFLGALEAGSYLLMDENNNTYKLTIK